MTARTALVRGGTVGTAADSFPADILIEGGRIAAVGDLGRTTVDETVDAEGCLVLPGGVDVHTHLEEPMDFVTRTADDFYTGTVAGAYGGTTTIVDFAKRHPDTSLYESYQRRLAVARGKPVIDYSFHGMITHTGLSDGGLEDMWRLAKEGVTSFKFFMAYPDRMMVDDGVILSAMHLAAKAGIMIMVHAENGHIVADATTRLIDSGQTEEHRHLHAHPDLAEGEAVNRAIALAEYAGAPLYVVHVSSRLAVDALREGRLRGRPVWGETCPQYLFAAYEDYADQGFDAAAYICSPPIRERANQEFLWHGLATDVLSTVGTDHACFRMSSAGTDLPPQKERGKGDFSKVPNGVPGIEERMMLMYEGGVVGGRFNINRLVDLCSTTPAKLFGLYPQKGTIAAGSDADLVVLDPAKGHVLGSRELHSAAEYTLYEGTAVSATPRYVISRGDVIISDGQLRAEAGRGQYLTRTAPQW